MDFRAFACILSLAAFLAVAHTAAQPLPQTSSAPPEAAASTPVKPCDPVANLFGKPICRAMLASAPAEPPPGITGDSAITYETQRQTSDVAQLRELVWRLALMHRFGSAAVNPSREEMENYRQALHAAMASSYDADKETVAYLQDVLQKNHYGPADEAKLQHLLTHVQMSVKLYEEGQAHAASLPKEMQFVTETTEAQIALGIIRAWKGDKALYEAYGGRLVITPTGIRPLDADIKFLNYIEHDGGLKVIDPAYKDVKQALQASIAVPPPITLAPPEVQKMYFTSPTWQLQFANSASRVAMLKAQIARIPTVSEGKTP